MRSTWRGVGGGPAIASTNIYGTRGATAALATMGLGIGATAHVHHLSAMGVVEAVLDLNGPIASATMMVAGEGEGPTTEGTTSLPSMGTVVGWVGERRDQ